ncbi:amidohydrolase 2 [Setomelanomma holmii]|uniref:Amidohydrolase 2 n=1 Tax=Setomelanomma holmii TaxID=210430 RepID=A0A9P4LS91_9PLEO|nr:amidohydrolase 2 [Setomelanomma holmii]
MCNPAPDLISKIHTNAARDSIILSSLPFLDEALSSISNLSATPLPNNLAQDFENATRIDTHTHPIPAWFRALEPNAAGRATPEWSVAAHLEFMATQGIKRSVLSVSTPQANAFLDVTGKGGRKEKTIALARILNEFVGEVCRLWPERFSWLAILPLPYVDEAVVEARYALEELGAVGVAVLTNHEAVYPGDEAIDGLWKYLQSRAEKSTEGRGVVFIHPTEPVISLDDGRFVNSRPSPLRSGLGEFYFETARAISSLIASSPTTTIPTFLKFPSLHFRVSHGAGAFPDISERFLLGFPAVAGRAREALRTRFWYDSAGPVFPNQIKGLVEGMGVGIGQMVFGTDYPYGIGFWDVNANIAGLADAGFLTDEEKDMVFYGNAERLWQGKIGGV